MSKEEKNCRWQTYILLYTTKRFSSLKNDRSKPLIDTLLPPCRKKEGDPPAYAIRSDHTTAFSLTPVEITSRVCHHRRIHSRTHTYTYIHAHVFTREMRALSPLLSTVHPIRVNPARCARASSRCIIYTRKRGAYSKLAYARPD